MTKTKAWDRIWIGGNLATSRPGPDRYGIIHDGALASKSGKIVWVGKEEDLPGRPADLAAEVMELGGRWITPGLVDCHTHLVFGGDRSLEFEARLGGATYEEVAKAGGGIRTTMTLTRAAGQSGLLRQSLPRLHSLLMEGVTTVEIKSGYGLDTDSELTMLRVGRELGRTQPVRVHTSFLGAHVVPPEFDGDREGYIDLLCREMIPRAAEEGLADAVDAFCDEIAFSVDECRTVLAAGRDHGWALRLHADQLSDIGGAALAAEMGARSADHLERTSPQGVKAMANAGTVAVLLPGAFYFLQDDCPPPVEGFRSEGVPMAVATDLNPGSSPVNSLLFSMNMACVLFGLSPEEAFRGVTAHAALALGLQDELGSLEKGKTADLAIWEIGHPRELSYWVGKNPCVGVVKDGEDSRLFVPFS